MNECPPSKVRNPHTRRCVRECAEDEERDDADNKFKCKKKKHVNNIDAMTHWNAWNNHNAMYTIAHS